MTKQMPRTIRRLDLTSLAAATGGMNLSLTPKNTVSSGGSSTSSGSTSVITSPSTPTSGPQIASVIQ